MPPTARRSSKRYLPKGMTRSPGLAGGLCSPPPPAPPSLGPTLPIRTPPVVDVDRLRRRRSTGAVGHRRNSVRGGATERGSATPFVRVAPELTSSITIHCVDACREPARPAD